jgi:hypothetical protein
MALVIAGRIVPMSSTDPIRFVPLNIFVNRYRHSPTSSFIANSPVSSIACATLTRSTFWNGVPFDRAVDLHADSETGARPDARQARALDSLTFRSLEYGPPPDEHWVDISYIDLKKKKRRPACHGVLSAPIALPAPAVRADQHACVVASTLRQRLCAEPKSSCSMPRCGPRNDRRRQAEPPADR